jgi:dihydroxy-acid dehydratase
MRYPKMHAKESKDPVVRQPEGVVLSLPSLEDTLRHSGIRSDRKTLIRRFMGEAPRVAIVSGSPDHPAQIYDAATAKAAVRSVWNQGGLPFLHVQPAICDGIAQGHQGMRYSLLLRNLTTASLCATMEGHGYHAALVLDSCDKRPAANVAALGQLDIQRQKDGRGPLFAVFLPAPVMREVRLPAAQQKELRRILAHLPRQDLSELGDLLKRPVKCNTYAMWKKFVDRCLESGHISESNRNKILAMVSESTCVAGGICGFYGTGNTSRMMLAALGLVPRGMDILPGPAGNAVVDRAVDRLMRLVRREDPQHSVSAIVRANLKNAARVWAATGGSTNWVLHLDYVADAVGEKMPPEYLGRISRQTPHIMRLDPRRALSMYSLARASKKEKTGAIEKIVCWLGDVGQVDVEAVTVDQRWKTRIVGASPGDGQIITRQGKPWRSSSGIVHLRGNIIDSAVVKTVGMTDEQLCQFDRKAYLVVFYLGEDEAAPDLFRGQPVLDRLYRKVSRASLLRVMGINAGNNEPLVSQKTNKRRIWSLMLERGLLRIMVAIAGEGPAACGMPEMYYPSEYLGRDPGLSRMTALFTDGRYSGATYGPCIGHAVPEAYRGGFIGFLHTGDTIYLDLSSRRMDLLTSRQNHFASASPRELRERPMPRSRLRKIQAKRNNILPSVRPLLDMVDSAANGVCFRKEK